MAARPVRPAEAITKNGRIQEEILRGILLPAPADLRWDPALNLFNVNIFPSISSFPDALALIQEPEDLGITGRLQPEIFTPHAPVADPACGNP